MLGMFKLCRRRLVPAGESETEECNGVVDVDAFIFCGRTKLPAKFWTRLYCCVKSAFDVVSSLCAAVVFCGLVGGASELPTGVTAEDVPAMGPATEIVVA